MHEVLNPKAVQSGAEYDYEEYCPLCDSFIPVIIDNNEFLHYQVECPVCGGRLMLCTLCHDDGRGCDWSQEDSKDGKCFRMDDAENEPKNGLKTQYRENCKEHAKRAKRRR